ncbi:MAG: clostripain-related cysteine peptidase [Mangrovibacterium sp.]
MNKLGKIWLASLAVAFLLTGCWWNDDDDDPEEYVILVYMAADNNLDSDVTYSLNQMKEGILTSKGTVVIYLDRANKAPRLFKLSPDGEEIALKEYAEENSANASTLARVIKETKELVPSKKFGLIIWGHSMAWVPKGYGAETRVTSFRLNRDYPRTRYVALDSESGGSLEIMDMADALPSNVAEFILFDVCLMSSVEALYEISNTCKYVIASPTEVLAEYSNNASGMPYAKALPYLFGGVTDLEKACEAYYDHYNGLSGFYRSATISLIDMQQLDDLYSVTAGILEGKLPQAEVLNVSDFQIYYTSNAAPVFFDMGDVVKTLSNAAQYLTFQQQLNKTVLYKAATENFITIPIDQNHFSGLSMYVPLSKWSANKEYNYYFSLDWAGVY